MATSQAEIRGWLESAKTSGSRWLIVVCDTWDFEDYPVEVKGDAAAFYAEYDRVARADMTRIMEVYDLDMDLPSQLQEFRANHPPERPRLS